MLTLKEHEDIATEVEDESRPGRDFVDRFWLAVLSRCETVACLTAGIQCVLRELGNVDALAPFVREDNTSDIAEIVRAAVKITKLRRYGPLSNAQGLEAECAAWNGRRKHFENAEAVATLALNLGVECLRRDLVHLTVRCGYITALDLAFYTDTSQSVPIQIDRLRCLHHIAELAVLCTRHRVSPDAMRHVVLKAVEYYQTPLHATGLSVPVFAVQLRNTSDCRLLSALLMPSSFVLECGASSIRVERTEGYPREVGTWVHLSSVGPLEYRVSLIERSRYV